MVYIQTQKNAQIREIKKNIKIELQKKSFRYGIQSETVTKFLTIFAPTLTQFLSPLKTNPRQYLVQYLAPKTNNSNLVWNAEVTGK